LLLANGNVLPHDEPVAGAIGVNDPADLSGADLRRALRALSPQRRREIARAVREGRAVDDSRDAALAVAWARRVQAAPWLKWVLPETRPHGRRAVLWLLHATWFLLAVATAVAFAWESLGLARWLVLAVLAYGIVSMPWLLAHVLRTRWNAPEAERRNSELLAPTARG
jgi:hypothetical protein